MKEGDLESGRRVAEALHNTPRAMGSGRRRGDEQHDIFTSSNADIAGSDFRRHYGTGKQKTLGAGVSGEQLTSFFTTPLTSIKRDSAEESAQKWEGGERLQ